MSDDVTEAIHELTRTIAAGNGKRRLSRDEWAAVMVAFFGSNQTPFGTQDQLCRTAYEYADAMLAASGRDNGESVGSPERDEDFVATSVKTREHLASSKRCRHFILGNDECAWCGKTLARIVGDGEGYTVHNSRDNSESVDVGKVMEDDDVGRLRAERDNMWNEVESLGAACNELRTQRDEALAEIKRLERKASDNFGSAEIYRKERNETKAEIAAVCKERDEARAEVEEKERLLDATDFDLRRAYKQRDDFEKELHAVRRERDELLRQNKSWKVQRAEWITERERWIADGNAFRKERDEARAELNAVRQERDGVDKKLCELVAAAWEFRDVCVHGKKGFVESVSRLEQALEAAKGEA